MNKLKEVIVDNKRSLIYIEEPSTVKFNKGGNCKLKFPQDIF